MAGGGGTRPVPASPVKAARVSGGARRGRGTTGGTGRCGRWAAQPDGWSRRCSALGPVRTRGDPLAAGGGAAREPGAAPRPCVRESGTQRFARGRSEVRAMEEEKYLPELMAEKDSLDPSFVHASRLLAEGRTGPRRWAQTLGRPSHPRLGSESEVGEGRLSPSQKLFPQRC